jgi:hypothetical protein
VARAQASSLERTESCHPIPGPSRGVHRPPRLSSHQMSPCQQRLYARIPSSRAVGRRPPLTVRRLRPSACPSASSTTAVTTTTTTTMALYRPYQDVDLSGLSSTVRRIARVSWSCMCSPAACAYLTRAVRLPFRALGTNALKMVVSGYRPQGCMLNSHAHELP